MASGGLGRVAATVMVLAMATGCGALRLSSANTPGAAFVTPGASLLHSRPASTPLRSAAARRGAVAARVHGGAPLMTASLASTAKTATLAYAVLVGAGGVFAGIKTGSKPSIISGVISCIILSIAYIKSSNPLALGTSIALTVVFGIRFQKTSKMMPAGMLGIVSGLMSLLLGMAQLKA
eukprot:CAMPEP_0173380950 /NCGR_PEP_ID=MMETSP1356-20130122/3491_1 /TAXON_ID=77927 ORGANISM="Hemiselmis virescens, Strain PCC157" /NCGR_SAMPLE_ID=MMETSP1356 /ASSEMBLY_ACC=CAM_ASM_000847 /LENGTH=178 /DNA_ID=CAMNT_0014334673 /DNA_START=12 /DNA_END=548 /DNA_ORIENTATION=-